MHHVKNKIGEKALISLLLALIGFVALTTAAYAWIGVSRVPFITNMSLSVLTENGIMITPDKDGKPDEEKWATYLNAEELFKDIYDSALRKEVDRLKVMVNILNKSAGESLLPDAAPTVAAP